MREESNKRTEDEALSNEVHYLLEKHFYNKTVADYKCITDKYNQVRGKDSTFTFNGFNYICDEKAAVRYRELKTFALELSFINKLGEVNEGWFTKDEIATNSYIFVWVEDNQIEFALVKKESIVKYLESIGWTTERLRKKAERIRNENDKRFGDISKNGCRFCMSSPEKYVEAPITVLLNKRFYLSIADYHDIIETNIFKGRGYKK